ncbi:ABC transporter permease [Catenulispora subtropica]|uniref:ABC transporter permease n=1 Tax=Catenulispora subtropica TaxID=450798 RepID=A0ABP5BNK6_9ACTN
MPLVFGVSMLTFFLGSLVPGDAARAILGLNADPDAVATLHHQLGLDRPLWDQYWSWLIRALHGDLGTSVASGSEIWSDLGARLPVTLWLIGGSVLVAAIVGVTLGVTAALRAGFVGRLVDVVALLGASVPVFWFALLLVTVFAVELRVFPAIGYVPLSQSPGQWASSLALPVLTLGLTSSAAIAKQTRDGVRTQMQRDYVLMLRARGVPERTIVFKHVLRNAGAPVVTLLGLLVVGMLGGTVLVEQVFVLPGLGGLAVDATRAHDIPEVQGVTVLFTMIIVTVNLAVELIHRGLDPKARA